LKENPAPLQCPAFPALPCVRPAEATPGLGSRSLSAAGVLPENVHSNQQKEREGPAPRLTAPRNCEVQAGGAFPGEGAVAEISAHARIW